MAFLEELWSFDPSFGSAVGRHEYDEFLTIKDKKWKDSFLAFIKKHENRRVVEDEIDNSLIQNFLKESQWELEIFKSYEWDPSEYNVAASFDSIVSNRDLSEEQKSKILKRKLTFVPAYYQAAKENIHHPTKEHLELSIQQTKGLIKFFDAEVLKRANNQPARDAVLDYLAWEEGLLKNPEPVGGFRSFRIGEKLYNEKFAFNMVSTTTPKELYESALRQKKETLKTITTIAKALWSKYFPDKKSPDRDIDVVRKVIEKVSLQHTPAEKFVEEIKKQIPNLEKFVNHHKLITMDPSKPLKVRETPEYQQDATGMSIDSPGVFEPYRETYYNVTPPTKLSKEEQESFLREYNDYTLQILNIHEAVPGHYVQLIYNNQSPSVIKAIFGNGATIEGWAVYAERMMLEAGYGRDTPELSLMYWKWFLRVITNTLIDYGVHTQNLSKEEALRLMMEDAFQEKQEAEGKWNRAKVYQGQLATYFFGFSEIYRLREDLKAKNNNFNLREFHEKFLSYGSAPISTIRSAMINN
ncbi:MAG: hypothetical protein A4S09_05720 [Proteobacteria bacterium SG_bin7]|nr:MAG: hypothetical protein A4S09_05720 [Proteobacteria bacterium SG_bin7]